MNAICNRFPLVPCDHPNIFLIGQFEARGSFNEIVKAVSISVEAISKKKVEK